MKYSKKNPVYVLDYQNSISRREISLSFYLVKMCSEAYPAPLKCVGLLQYFFSGIKQPEREADPTRPFTAIMCVHTISWHGDHVY